MIHTSVTRVGCVLCTFLIISFLVLVLMRGLWTFLRNVKSSEETVKPTGRTDDTILTTQNTCFSFPATQRPVMVRHAYLVFVLFGAAFGGGCLGRQFARDGASMQEAVADIYTDQAMENLIRARNNLPFVQLKFSGINVNDTDDISFSGSVKQTVETARDLFTATAMRTLTNEYDATATDDRKRVMALNADPVTDQNDVYARYMAFVSEPDLLMCSDTPPGCPVHILRKWRKKYYWIPCEAGPAFLDLVLKTTLMRGPEAAPPSAYQVKILDVIEVTPAGPGIDSTTAIVAFDTPVPNGEGSLVVDLEDGRRVRASLLTIDVDADNKRVTLGQPTTRLKMKWSPIRDGFTEFNLKTRPGRVYSRDYPPEAAVPNPVLQKIAVDVNQIKVNQFSGTR